MDLNAALVFVRVIQAGSFSKAARQFEMPVSTVSAKVAALEKSLGVSLISRTTRRLRLTDPGEVFFKHAVRAISELQIAQTLTQESQEGIHGKVRVTAPVEVGMTSLADCVADFMAKYPTVQVELLLTDRLVDLVGEGFDIAIRIGELKDSTLISKRIGASGTQAYASPAYLKKSPPIKKPADLLDHSCLIFTNAFNGEWLLEKGQQSQKVAVKTAFAANNLITLHRLILQNRGVALLPAYLCQDDVEKKRLIPVLDGWATRRFPVHLIYPQQSFVPKSTRALIDHLSDTMHDFF